MNIVYITLHKLHMLFVVLSYWLFNKMAIACLCRHNVRMGKNIVFKGKAGIQIAPSATISIGDCFTCHSDSFTCIDNSTCSKIIVYDKANLSIGHNSGMSNTVIHCMESISIGNYVNIGAGTMIFDSDFHSTYWLDRHEATSDHANTKHKSVVIGDDVFIGTRSIICKGVTIGNRSIIAAGSVVVSDIPADCIAGGNPCKFIRTIEK